MTNRVRRSDEHEPTRSLANSSALAQLIPCDFEVMLRQRLTGRVAIMGIGNMMRSDDGFGTHLVNTLQSARISSRVKLFTCETTPENFVGPVREFRPDTIVMIDAAELGEPPGAVRLVASHGIADLSATTHNFSLRLLAQVLESTTNARVFLLAVQPTHTCLGTGLTPEILNTLHYLADCFHRVL